MIKITKHKLKGYPKTYHKFAIEFVNRSSEYGVYFSFNRSYITITLGGTK